MQNKDVAPKHSQRVVKNPVSKIWTTICDDLETVRDIS